MTTAELETHKNLDGPAATPVSAPWYKDAIIYQLHVRAFQDSNNDGIGDFRGLTSRLDYVQDLGVTAIWLLPFFVSPMRDDGYDIADYKNVNPQYGTLDDFRTFLEEAHQRDLRVITELVLNHTSDQHEWFQHSRRAAPDAPWRDWYVWSDSPDKYREARIIFRDFETSNWSWDPVAKAYFWHRFYGHQPDLNFDNPEVRREMIETVDFWFETGVDGLRLDAVPYLFEREGTNCENLPETHEFLRGLRSHIDKNFSDKMLLAEANQWPEDAAAYFGDGDECHMNFHFPLMPRLFMAVVREDQSPIVDILEQTPLVPPTCQWAIFLRSHDELTLEMVTDEERDYMYRTYSLDAKARINLGIRRRLAPLMGNDRPKIELMKSLLLSLPGTPILYYGDEIGMGDNYYLGDRNGVRTPMQWSADRNAGFSRANPQSLYLPIIIDPAYHYEARNVDNQHSNSNSLLWWTRRILDLRKQYPAFGRGSFEPLATGNVKVFAFTRETDSETLLIVANLSRLSQYTELDLSRYTGHTLTELFGRTAFPTIGEHLYRLSLGPYGFYWFRLGCRDGDEQAAERNLPTISLRRDLSNLFTGRNSKLLGRSLEPYLRHQRWFAGKARTMRSVELVDWVQFEQTERNANLYCLIAKANYADGDPDFYCIPVVLLNDTAAEDLNAKHHGAAIARLKVEHEERGRTMYEATLEPGFWRQMLALVSNGGRMHAHKGIISGMQTSAYARVLDGADDDSPPHVHSGEQSNTSAIFDEKIILKLFRRLTPGTNPDLEIGRQLTEHHKLPIVPMVAGAVEYTGESREPLTLAVLHEFIPNVGDAWKFTLGELARYFEHVQSVDIHEFDANTEQTHDAGQSLVSDVKRSVLKLCDLEPPPLAQHTIGGFLSLVELLGQRVGELHVALATADSNTAFGAEPFTRLYQRGLYQSMSSQARGTMGMLRSQQARLGGEASEQAKDLLGCEQSLYSKFSDLTRELIHAKRIRCHGDLHLGQVLFTGTDFVIIDFEGEPERPVSERRIKASALRDVAGMLRSFHYVAHAALRGHTHTLIVQHSELPIEVWANYWAAWVSASFLRAYRAAAKSGEFLPRDRNQLGALLRAYLLEKALYELRYELNNRPDWVNIPLDGIKQYCGNDEQPMVK